MKNTRMILLVAFVITANTLTVYTVVSLFMGEGPVPDVVGQLVLGGMALSVVLAIACIAFAAATHRQVEATPLLQKGLRAPVLVCKLVMIPYFILITVLGFLMIFVSSLLTVSVQLASLGILLGLASIVMLPVISVVNYLYVLATSAFSISAIVTAGRRQIISRSTMTVYLVLQLLPIVDVISYIFIVAQLNKLQQAPMPEPGY